MPSVLRLRLTGLNAYQAMEATMGEFMGEEEMVSEEEEDEEGASATADADAESFTRPPEAPVPAAEPLARRMHLAAAWLGSIGWAKPKMCADSPRIEPPTAPHRRRCGRGDRWRCGHGESRRCGRGDEWWRAYYRQAGGGRHGAARGNGRALAAAHAIEQ